MMFKQLLALAVAMLPFTSAHPLAARAVAPSPLSAADTSVVQLALFLEHLEFNLYSGGYANFTEAQYEAAGFPPGFRDLIGVTASQESVHAMTLTSVLEANNVTPVPNCTYMFPYTDPKSFVDLANMITTVGIGAYLGGSGALQDNPGLLTAAASILTVEARHDSFLRAGLGASPFPVPFDTPLSADFAYNLALEFVVSCPTYLPLTDLPALTLVSPTPSPNLQPPVGANTTLTFNWDASKVNNAGPLYIALINQDNPPVFEAITSCGTGCGTVPVPDGVAGIAFGALTAASSGTLSTLTAPGGTLAGPAEIALS